MTKLSKLAIAAGIGYEVSDLVNKKETQMQIVPHAPPQAPQQAPPQIITNNQEENTHILLITLGIKEDIVKLPLQT